MSDAAIIRGTFADFKLIKGRKVAQVVIEVPIEEADAALRALGGVPMPHLDRWCAVALLRDSIATLPSASTPPCVTAADKPMPVEPEATAPSITKAGRNWREISFSQQAGILSADADFQQWLGVSAGLDADDEITASAIAGAAAVLIRERCGVTSRAELDRDPDAAERWIKLSHDFFGRQDTASLERAYRDRRG